MTRYIDRDLLGHMMWKPEEKVAPQQLPPPILQQEWRPTGGTYILLPQQSTYAQGVDALKEACKAEANPAHPQFVLNDGSRVYRPLTFKETIEAQVTDYENHKDPEERLRLFKRQNDSCTGIVYQAGTTKFKIVPICLQLITIYKDFNGTALSIKYDDLEGVEVDRAAGKYTAWLLKDEVLTHEGWRAAVEGDIELLKAYRDIVFAERNTAMAFAVLDRPTDDQIRFLFASHIYNNFNAVGTLNLSFGGSFLHFVDDM
ncbi:MAG: hypothetical protein Q8R47_00800 [Nanoarchaeota archaeon]|nr:hypothetical protein [Nanoarchaeota archaeon]